MLGSVNDIASLRELTIPTPNGQVVRLTDVAQIGDGSSEIRGFARLNGRPVVAVQIMKTREASDVQTEDRVIAARVAQP